MCLHRDTHLMRPSCSRLFNTTYVKDWAHGEVPLSTPAENKVVASQPHPKIMPLEVFTKSPEAHWSQSGTNQIAHVKVTLTLASIQVRQISTSETSPTFKVHAANPGRSHRGRWPKWRVFACASSTLSYNAGPCLSILQRRDLPVQC